MAKPKGPLELSIDSFIEQAQAYHSFRVAGPKKGKTAGDFRADLENRWFSLENARRKISCQAWIEYDIALGLQSMESNPEYKRKTDSEIRELMLEEAHHPTTGLRKNMLKAGKFAPDNKFSCHHIVEGRGKLVNKMNGKKVQNAVVVNSRMIIHSVGIGINDAGNGVWLPTDMKYVPHRAMPKALPHRNIHTYNYENHVYKRLSNALKSKMYIRMALNTIARELQTSKDRSFLTKKSQNNFKDALITKEKQFA